MEKKTKQTIEKVVSFTCVFLGIFSSGFIIGNTGTEGVLASGFLLFASLVIFGLEEIKELNLKNISPPKAKAMGIRNGRTI